MKKTRRERALAAPMPVGVVAVACWLDQRCPEFFIEGEGWGPSDDACEGLQNDACYWWKAHFGQKGIRSFAFRRAEAG